MGTGVSRESRWYDKPPRGGTHKIIRHARLSLASSAGIHQHIVRQPVEAVDGEARAENKVMRDGHGWVVREWRLRRQPQQWAENWDRADDEGWIQLTAA